MSFNDQVREIVEHVNEKRSVVVDGKRGSGRSTLVARVVGELERRGRHVLTAAGHRAFSSQPYAGLEMLGFSVGKTPAERQPLVVADMVSRELIASEAGLVTLDDIELFDRLSLDVLDVALDRIGKPWLATVQPPADGADGVRQFLDRWPSARLRMEPLRFDEVRALVASRLSGPISADLIGRVLTLSSGSPLLATEIIDSGALSQEIHRVDGVWQSRSFGVWNRHLESVVNGMLGELQPDEVDALHTMAVLGVEPAARILQVVDAETLASLDRRGMIATLGDDPEDRWLAVDPPLLSEYFRHRSDAVATLIVSRRTDELFGARRSPGRAVATGGFPDLLVALGQQNAREDAVVARYFSEQKRLAAKARWGRWNELRTPLAALDYLAAAGSGPTEVECIATVYAQTARDADDPDSGALTISEAQWLAFSRNEPDEAIRILAAFSRGYPAWEPECVAMTTIIESAFTGIPRDAFARLTRVSSQGATHSTADITRALLLICSGEPYEAESVLDQVGFIDGAELVTDFCRGLALYFTGRLDEALVFSTRRRDEARNALDLDAVCAHTYICVLAMIGLGLWRDAERFALGLLTLDRPLGYMSLVRSATLRLCALIAFSSGEEAMSDSLQAEAGSGVTGLGPLPGMGSSVLDALHHLDDGEQDFGHKMEALIDRACDRGYIAVAVNAAIGAYVSEPSPHLYALLTRTLTGVHANIHAPLLRIAGLLNAGDLVELELAIIGYEADGDVNSIGTVLRTTASRLTGDGEHTASREILAMEARLSTRLPAAAAVGRSKPRGSARLLSAREREVALLAGDHSNAQIADRLVISVRTVEKHVANAMKRTGAASRVALFELVSAMD